MKINFNDLTFISRLFLKTSFLTAAGLLMHSEIRQLHCGGTAAQRVIRTTSAPLTDTYTDNKRTPAVLKMTHPTLDTVCLPHSPLKEGTERSRAEQTG